MVVIASSCSVASRRPRTISTTSRGALFATPGYGVFDLFWHYDATDWMRVDAGISNLGDRRYWQWSSVRGFAPEAREVDLATQSGRSFMVSLRIGG